MLSNIGLNRNKWRRNTMHVNNRACNVAFKISPKELNAWKLAARRDHRSLAGWIRVVINKQVGYEPDPVTESKTDLVPLEE
jgi:hypothetical protein